MAEGHRVVLSGSKTALSYFNHFSYIGFLGCIPSNYTNFPWNHKLMERVFFPTKSDYEGLLRFAPYPLRKIEAALLE